jgi:hypothetical protein
LTGENHILKRENNFFIDVPKVEKSFFLSKEVNSGFLCLYLTAGIPILIWSGQNGEHECRI